MKIDKNKLVTLQYKLYTMNEKNNLELWEETTPEEPLQYLHGLGMMIPAFEEQLEGKAEGDDFDFMIAKADAYGEYEQENVINLPKHIFLIDGKFDAEKVKEGEIVPLMDNEGNHINAEVVEVADDHVRVDLNHPLAGEDLYFKGRIIAVTQPTDEELAEMMQPHHCCGGCGDEGCDDGCCKDNGGCHGCN